MSLPLPKSPWVNIAIGFLIAYFLLPMLVSTLARAKGGGKKATQ